MNLFKSNKKYKNLAEAIERKASLIESKKDLLVKIGSHKDRLSMIGRQILDERDAVHGYSNTAVPKYKKLKEQREYTLNSLLREREDLSALFEADSAALSSVNSELENIDQIVSAGEVIQHQKDVIKKTELVDHLQNLIDEQQAIINTKNDTGIDTSSLYNKKSDLLADIAQGEDKHDELNEINTEITQKEKQKSDLATKKEAAANQALQTKAGLIRKLEIERQGLERLHKHTPCILDQFLLTESKKLCKEYLLCANKTRKYMLRLAALQELIVSQGERNGAVIFPENIQACIPGIVQSLAPNASCDGILLDGKIMKDGHFMSEIIKTEIERFEAMGIVSIYSR